MKTLAAGLALAVLVLAQPAAAQDVQGILVEVTGAGTIPYKGAGQLGVQLDVGCAEVLQAPGESVTLAIEGAPAWLNFTAEPVALSPTGCLNPAGRVTATGVIDVTVGAAAPAVVQHVVSVVATLGATSSDPATGTLSVAYNSDYSVVPSVTFPLTVTNKTTTFTVTGTQASNAPSMIMVDEFSASNGALVSGFGALQYLNDAGKPETKTYTITFTAPNEDWETATITLRVYGHYNFPDGSAAGEPMDHKTLTWEVTNGGVHEEHKDGKDSPAPVAAFTALGLLAFAAMRRRKQD